MCISKKYKIPLMHSHSSNMIRNHVFCLVPITKHYVHEPVVAANKAKQVYYIYTWYVFRWVSMYLYKTGTTVFILWIDLVPYIRFI